MSFVIPLPANLVLALFTAACEILLLPLAKIISERFEAKRIRQELFQGHAIQLKRYDIGPIRLPIGRITISKLFVVIFLSFGLVVVVAFMEFGMKPLRIPKDVTKRSSQSFYNTRSDSFKQGRVFPSDIDSGRKWHECVEIGKLDCAHSRHSSSTCLRSIFYRAVQIGNETICLDKETGDLRNASDVDIASYEGLTAELNSEGKELTIEGYPLIKAQMGTVTLEGEVLRGVVVYRERFGGVNLFWNDTGLFISMHVVGQSVLHLNSGSNGNKNVFHIETGIFPNGHNKPEDYLDSAASILVTSMRSLRMDSIRGILMSIHYGSSRLTEGSYAFTSSEFSSATRVETSSYATLLVVLLGLLGIFLVSFGDIFGITTYNGLSRQYDDDIEQRGNSENARYCVKIRMTRDMYGAVQHIGSVGGGECGKRNENLWLERGSIEACTKASGSDKEEEEREREREGEGEGEGEWEEVE